MKMEILVLKNTLEKAFHPELALCSVLLTNW